MGSEDTEKELEQFLAEQPSWVRKTLERDFPLDGQDEKDCSEALERDGIFELAALEKQYQAILRRIPARWREYRRKLKRIALRNVPSGKPGRPRKDEEREELRKKHQEGKSYRRIAIARLPVPQRSDDPEGSAERELAITREAQRIRKLITSRETGKPRSTPDKT